MNDICRDTLLVRMSDAAGFEGEDQKKQHDTRWLDEIVDEQTSVDDLRDILERGFFTCRIDDEGDIVVRDLVNFYIHPASEGLMTLGVWHAIGQDLPHDVVQVGHRRRIDDARTRRVECLASGNCVWQHQ